MVKINIIIVLAAALIPMVFGFIWYNPKVMGNVWMKAAGLEEEKMKEANMPLIFGLSFLFSFFLAFAMQFMVIHQFHLGSILLGEEGLNDPNSALGLYVKAFMENYGDNYRTFKHGAFHGFLGGFTLALPMIGTNALFERKGWKYIAVNVGYWTICMTLMGGIICAFT
ncbi:MAG: hypothetical protein RL060_1342 [Bacteroidota bacterium]|jgi:hypothetical protein